MQNPKHTQQFYKTSYKLNLLGINSLNDFFFLTHFPNFVTDSCERDQRRHQPAQPRDGHRTSQGTGARQ